MKAGGPGLSPGNATKKVLVVEDEAELARLVELHLVDLGLGVVHTADGRRGLDLALQGDFDLVILDLMLPGLDGIEVCKGIRRSSRYTPVLMLTARSGEADRVLGLEVGADDYLTKPFSIRELVARVRAILRRVEALSSPVEESERIEAGPLELDLDSRRVRLDGAPVELTAKEFDLLAHFAGHPGKVYSRSQLLDLVWGYGYGGYEHTVNSHIHRLRSKIEQDPSAPRFIETVWGVGYRFREPASP